MSRWSLRVHGLPVWPISRKMGLKSGYWLNPGVIFSAREGVWLYRLTDPPGFAA